MTVLKMKSLDKHIKLVESYLEIKGIASVFKACRLKPYKFVPKDLNKLILFNKWVDEFGNTIEVKKNKLHFIYNDLTVDHSKIVSTDLYYGLSISNIAKMSKMVHLVSAKDEDMGQPYYSLSFYGLDNYLRTYIYLYGKWHQVSPLLLGVTNLLTIIDNSDINYFRQLNNKEKTPIPCQKIEQWLVSLPIGTSFMSRIENDYQELEGLFK